METDIRIEKHPFGSFLAENTQYLIVGTFPGKQFSQLPEGEVWLDETAWSYGGKNQFWRIVEKIYAVTLTNRSEKQALLSSLNIGMCDLIASCHRKDNNNLDNNLVEITWNKAVFETLLAKKSIEKIFCTGKNVAAILGKWFPEQQEKIIALPSPSPRYANMRLEEKVDFYKKVFPAIKKP